MKLRQEVDLNRLWELARQGKSADEIRQELDITDMAWLKRALQGLMQEKGETVNVPGLIGEGSMEGRYTKTGSRLPQDMPGDFQRSKG